jgi:hypothetical protein
MHVKEKNRLATYIDPDLKQRLEKLAKSEKRSVSNLLEILIEEACKNFERKEKLKNGEV